MYFLLSEQSIRLWLVTTHSQFYEKPEQYHIGSLAIVKLLMIKQFGFKLDVFVQTSPRNVAL